jgi:HD superfamily phosphohydrolase
VSTRWHDPVHGQVAISPGPGAADIEAIVESRPLGRLRGIKQLGFAAYTFPMADHSRFTHALGSMHVAGLLAQKVLHDATIARSLKPITEEFAVVGPVKEARASLVAHVQAAALLQDAGELPYENSLRGLYRPDEALKNLVGNWIAIDSGSHLDDKEVFTLALIRDLSRRKLLTELDPGLIAMIACRKISGDLTSNTVIRRMRNILDSPIDADRIDYVYRDALLTIGAIGNPGQVVNAIETYGDSNVVVTNPAHVGALLMARNYLYRSVYLDPPRRLREQALRQVFRHVVVTKSTDPRPWELTPLPGDITIEQFLALDDSAIASAVGQLAVSASLATLPENVQRALNTLRDEANSRYESVWVSPVDVGDYDEKRKVPEGIVADPRDDYIRVGASNLDFIHVAAEHFYGSDDQKITSWIPELAAPDSLATTASILAFVPLDMDGRTRRSYEKAWDDGSLYTSLKRQLMEEELSVPADTRKLSDFSGEAIHISFCWADVDEVKRVVRHLHMLRRRYYLLLDPFDGIGASTRKNSKTVIQTAPRLLIVASGNYVKRALDDPNGNIAVELDACHELSVTGKLPAHVVLSIDDWKFVKDKFPWRRIGESEEPFFGKDIRLCSEQELKDLMAKVVDVLK